MFIYGSSSLFAFLNTWFALCKGHPVYVSEDLVMAQKKDDLGQDRKSSDAGGKGPRKITGKSAAPYFQEDRVDPGDEDISFHARFAIVTGEN